MNFSDTERAVLGQIDAESIADLTAALIRAGADPAPEQATAHALAAALGAIGDGVEVELDDVAPGRPNLVARVGSDDGVLFLGHSDVVDPGGGWSGDPFDPRRAGDDLIGRGSADMKGGLAAVVAAMAAVREHDPTASMTLLCTVDEEADARGALHHLATTAPRPYRACVVAEPTGLVTITACRGAMNLRVQITGSSAHAGRPEHGTSAILAAADLIAAVEADHERLALSPHPTLGPATWNVGTILGGHGTSIVADSATLTIDRRTLPDEDPQAIRSTLLAAARERHRDAARRDRGPARFEGEIEMVMPGFATAPDAALVRRARSAVRAVGRPGAAAVWSAACEGGYIARHHDVPTIVLGPGDLLGQAHQPDERVSVTELADAARAYALIALNYAGSQSPGGGDQI